MQIICPHCTTSYDVNPANFSDAGRKVRCARCQEVWLAKPEPVSVMAAAEPETEYSGYSEAPIAARAANDDTQPYIDSPSISADSVANESDASWTATAQQDEAADRAEPQPKSRFHSLGRPIAFRNLKWLASLPTVNLNTACVAMGAMVLALVIWRADVVRLMPQTGAFFKMMGLSVNLRGLSIGDVKITTEMANNKPVLLIEGTITDVARKVVEIPRLRFIVRDAKGTDLYAWNAVLEQPSLIPGEKAWFRTRLAAPPSEGREIAVRFFHKLDLVSGGS